MTVQKFWLILTQFLNDSQLNETETSQTFHKELNNEKYTKTVTCGYLNAHFLKWAGQTPMHLWPFYEIKLRGQGSHELTNTEWQVHDCLKAREVKSAAVLTRQRRELF